MHRMTEIRCGKRHGRRVARSSVWLPSRLKRKRYAGAKPRCDPKDELMVELLPRIEDYMSSEAERGDNKSVGLLEGIYKK